MTKQQLLFIEIFVYVQYFIWTMNYLKTDETSINFVYHFIHLSSLHLKTRIFQLHLERTCNNAVELCHLLQAYIANVWFIQKFLWIFLWVDLRFDSNVLWIALKCLNSSIMIMKKLSDLFQKSRKLISINWWVKK